MVQERRTRLKMHSGHCAFLILSNATAVTRISGETE